MNRWVKFRGFAWLLFAIVTIGMVSCATHGRTNKPKNTGCNCGF